MCEISHDEYATIWEEDVVIARKLHRCDQCGGDIKPGTAYSKHFSLFEGDVTSEKRCYPCSVVTETFMDMHGTSFVPSQMASAINECIWEEGKDSEAAKMWTLRQLEMDQRQKRRWERMSREWCPARPRSRRKVEVAHA